MKPAFRRGFGKYENAEEEIKMSLEQGVVASITDNGWAQVVTERKAGGEVLLNLTSILLLNLTVFLNSNMSNYLYYNSFSRNKSLILENSSIPLLFLTKIFNDYFGFLGSAL